MEKWLQVLPRMMEVVPKRPLTRHTTYKAEVVGVLLALELIHREHSASSATI